MYTNKQIVFNMVLNMAVMVATSQTTKFIARRYPLVGLAISIGGIFGMNEIARRQFNKFISRWSPQAKA